MSNQVLLFLGCGFLLLGVLVYKTFFLVEKHQTAVIIRLGKIHRIVQSQTDRHCVFFLFPIIEQVFLIDMRPKYFEIITTAQKNEYIGKNQKTVKIDIEMSISMNYQVKNDLDAIRKAFLFSSYICDNCFSPIYFESNSLIHLEKTITKKVSKNIQKIIAFLSLKELQDNQDIVVMLLSKRLQKNMEEVGVAISNVKILDVQYMCPYPSCHKTSSFFFQEGITEKIDQVKRKPDNLDS